jgi:hypothetical protein
MAVFRVQLADDGKRLKTDLKAPNEDEARSVAARCFDGARWRITESALWAIDRLARQYRNDPTGPDAMSEVSTGFKTRLEYVLDQICATTTYGGSHEMRRFVAEQLIAAAEAGERSLDGLMEVARQALAAFLTRTGTA